MAINEKRFLILIGNKNIAQAKLKEYLKVNCRINKISATLIMFTVIWKTHFYPVTEIKEHNLVAFLELSPKPHIWWYSQRKP